MKYQHHVFIFFGIPGSGKSFFAKKFARRYGFIFYEADDDYTLSMRQKSKKSITIKNQINHKFYSNLCAKIFDLQKKHSKIVISSALGNNLDRHILLNYFQPYITFIQIDSDYKKRIIFLYRREKKDNPDLGLNIIKKHLEYKKQTFQKPDFKFLKFTNNYNHKSIEEFFHLIENKIPINILKLPSRFANNCYCLLKKVPMGRVTTYKDLANALGTKAYRAVGQSLRKNPFSPEVPCHRVIRTNGNIGGFAFGVKKKIQLLKKEGIKIKNNKVQNLSKIKYKF